MRDSHAATADRRGRQVTAVQRVMVLVGKRISLKRRGRIVKRTTARSGQAGGRGRAGLVGLVAAAAEVANAWGPPVCGRLGSVRGCDEWQIMTRPGRAYKIIMAFFILMKINQFAICSAHAMYRFAVDWTEKDQSHDAR